MASQTESILITSSPIQPAPTKANLKRKASKAAPPASAKGSLSSSEKAAGAKKQKANTEAATVGAAKDSNAPPKGYVAVNGVPSELWSEKALKRYKTLRIKSDKCDPDQFDMREFLWSCLRLQRYAMLLDCADFVRYKHYYTSSITNDTWQMACYRRVSLAFT